MGLDFTKNSHFQELLKDPQYFPALMYPGQDAITADTITEKMAAAAGTVSTNVSPAPQKKLLLIILDATWFCAKKMIEHNQFLLDLPKLSFSGSYRSIFTFKREPSPECISTIECCYYIIKELQTGGFVDTALDPEPLMNIFKAIIKLQLTAENERVLGIRTNSHDYDAKYNKIKEIPDFLQKE